MPKLTHLAVMTTLLSMPGALLPHASQGQSLDWLERLALSNDRSAVLAELIPGSTEHYFYHCLNHQLTGELDKAEALLTQWKTDPMLAGSQSLQSIEDRQRLLTYSQSPDRTTLYFKNRLGVEFDHPAPTTVGQRLHPSTFDNQLIDPQRLIDDVSLEQLSREGLRRYVDRVLSGNAVATQAAIRGILNRVNGPWMPSAAKLVVKELQGRRAQEQSFGDLAAHSWLTLAELREVATAVPNIANSEALVNAVLARLRPSADEDMRQQPDVRAAYLQRVDVYVSTLSDAYISLKAATIFQRLQANLERGHFDRDLFLRYLKLPRNSQLVPLPLIQGRGAVAQLSQDYGPLAMIPAINDEQPVVLAHLEHFLKDADSTAAFDPWLRPDYLRQVFAETKLLAGIEPADRWFAMLDPARRQALRDRIELTLAPPNPRIHDAQSSSKLLLDLKHVDALVVRIYRINTASYYRTHENQVDTDIDLDGLVPTNQRQIDYSLAPTRRHRETLDLPEIKGRGVWIVDLLGGGLRARAMIRRGELQSTVTASPGGLRVTAIDENRRSVAGAKLVIAGRELIADENGEIDVPTSDQAAVRTAVLQDNDLAIPLQLASAKESYALQAAMLIDRQQLQSGKQADLVIRPRLLMSGKPIDPTLLQSAAIIATATDLDGVTTTRRYEKIELDQDREITVSLRVPARLVNLKVELTGQIRGLAKNEVSDLRASQDWDVATIRRTTHTSTAHLTRDGDSWVIETRGRGGEPIAAKSIQITLNPSVRTTPVYSLLQSDERGRINLGKLGGIDSLTIADDSGVHAIDLNSADAYWPPSINVTFGTNVKVPLPITNAESSRFRLLGLRGDDTLAVDVATLVTVADGTLTLSSLQPGNYQLHDLQSGEQITIAVTDGPVLGNVAIGKVRQLELAPRSEIAIESIVSGDDGLRVKVGGSGPLTRVHVLVRRYVDSGTVAGALRLPDLSGSVRGVWHATSGYISDLRLGEEYQYVMRRQYAAKYPGVMLPQPGLILNPWETRSTDNESQTVAAGDAPMAAARPEAAMMEAESLGRKHRASAETLLADYDFLSDSGGVALNLRPDAQGYVSIPRDVVEGMPIVEIVVADPLAVVSRTWTQPLVETKIADLRLAKSLDAKRAMAFARGVVIASADKPLDLKSLGTAQLQLYSSIPDLMRLYMTLQSDPRLKEFLPIANWHTLDDNGKRSLYGRLACHELHLFLSVHDRDFFDAIIRPYLSNKAEKQFIDHYLLGNDLTPWTQMWQYRELTAVEKVLLAKRIPAMAPTVVREFREWREMRPDDADELRRLVESGLAGEAMMEQANGRMNFGAAVPAESADFFAMGDTSLGMAMAEPSGGVAGGGAADGAERKLSMRGLSRDKKEANVPMLSKLMFDRRGRNSGIAFYQNLDGTKQWAESQWDRIRVTTMGGVNDNNLQNPELIPINGFWLALAQSLVADEGAQFATNEQLLRPIETRHAVLTALALSGLPLDGGDVKLPVDDALFAPVHPVAIVTKRLVELEPVVGEPALLVGQRFTDLAAGDDSSIDVPVAPSEYVIHHVYRGDVIVTNPTPQRQTVDLLWQIPAGSLPLAGGQATDSRTVVLQPYAVERIEYSFYFPKPGDYLHYPVCVGSDGRVVARGTERTFNVVAVPSKLDEESWPAVAAAGDATKIEMFLAKANLRKIDLGLVAHRMKDRSIYDVVTKRLATDKIARLDLWGYALFHRDQSGMKVFFTQQESLVQSVGPVMRSDLLEVIPIDRRMYEFLEYSPLVQGRIHPLRSETEILNPTFKEQYLGLLRVLSYQRDTNPTQRLSIVYYMILQNRIEEAIARFAKIDAGQVESQLQYDYLAGYLALHRGDYEMASKVAQSHAEHPVPRWRERFVAMADQLRQRNELRGGSQMVKSEDTSGGVKFGDGELAVIDRDKRNAASATTEAFVKVDVDGRSLRIEHRNASAATVNLYAVDLELLFSKTPFVRDDLATMAMIQPTRSETLELESKDGVRSWKLDDSLARQTLLVEVISGAARSTTLYYGGTLSAYVSEGFGQIQVADSTNRQPVEGAYVKVYSRHQEGRVSFYKDGYTDLRGRFDYASLSTGDLATTQRFSILVIDPERGVTLQEAAPPVQPTENRQIDVGLVRP